MTFLPRPFSEGYVLDEIVDATRVWLGKNTLSCEHKDENGQYILPLIDSVEWGRDLTNRPMITITGNIVFDLKMLKDLESFLNAEAVKVFDKDSKLIVRVWVGY